MLNIKMGLCKIWLLQVWVFPQSSLSSDRDMSSDVMNHPLSFCPSFTHFQSFFIPTSSCSDSEEEEEALGGDTEHISLPFLMSYTCNLSGSSPPRLHTMNSLLPYRTSCCGPEPKSESLLIPPEGSRGELRLRRIRWRLFAAPWPPSASASGAPSPQEESRGPEEEERKR